MRGCIQRFDNHVRQNAVDWHTRFLRVKQQFAVLNPVHVKLDCITNSQTRIPQQENE